MKRLAQIIAQHHKQAGRRWPRTALQTKPSLGQEDGSDPIESLPRDEVQHDEEDREIGSLDQPSLPSGHPLRCPGGKAR